MNDHLPALSALRAFEAAARHMSFSKAAEELFVTPAAISHQIHALEQDLGVKLFHRLNRSIELTASARVLLPGLSDAFAEIRVLGPAIARPQRHRKSDGDGVAVLCREMAGVAVAPLSIALRRGRCAYLSDRRGRRSDQGRFRHRDPLRRRALPGPRRRIAVYQRGLSGVQPAIAGGRAAIAHARRSAPSRADPRSGGRARPAGADLADVAEGRRGQRMCRPPPVSASTI